MDTFIHKLNKDYIKIVKSGKSMFNINDKTVWLQLWYIAHNPWFGY